MINIKAISAKLLFQRFFSLIVIFAILVIILFLTYEENVCQFNFEKGFNPIYGESNLESDGESNGETDSISDYSPAAKTSKYNIDINLDEHLMYVYKDGILFKTYPVSGGKSSTPSPIGTWKIIGKDTWGEGFGGAWMGLNIPWGKYGIHGTYSPWNLGRANSSKGCIRMKNIDVKELYKYIPYGTTVTIVQNKVVFRIMKNGHFGSDVYNVQKMLKTLGYFNGYVNGKFSSSTDVAVAKFQKNNKLYGKSVVYKNTYELMKKLSQEKLEQTVPEISPQPSPQPTPQPSVQPT